MNWRERDHKTRTATCKGVLVDPPHTYGEWAYWWANSTLEEAGWHNAPGPIAERAAMVEGALT